LEPPGSAFEAGSAPKSGPEPTTTTTTRENNPVRPLRYSINVTLDGCCDHRAITPDEELHRFHAANLERSDALLFGRVIYEMMEEAWRRPDTGTWPDWMPEWMVPFAETIDSAKKYVVSGTLDQVDWNAELVRGDLGDAVRQLKQQPGDGLSTGGLTLPLALADLGLIDEYEFVVHPVLAGHGPTLFAGLREQLELELVGREEFRSGAVALRYRPGRGTD
jgi:dihydrofolate reductase